MTHDDDDGSAPMRPRPEGGSGGRSPTSPRRARRQDPANFAFCEGNSSGRSPAPTGDLPPLPVADVLAHIVWSVSAALVDLWTLRESIEAHAHPDHALAMLPELAGHLDAASDRLQAVADVLGVPLPPESPLFDG